MPARGKDKTDEKEKDVKKTPAPAKKEVVKEAVKATEENQLSEEEQLKQEEQAKLSEEDKKDLEGDDKLSQEQAIKDKIEEDKRKAEEANAKLKAEQEKKEKMAEQNKISEEKTAELAEKKVRTVKVKFIEDHTFQVGTDQTKAKKGDVISVEIHTANKFVSRKIAYILG